MIRLIATDIDGTLVKDSTPILYDEMKEMVKKLTAQGIYFVAASGRGYPSIRKMFAEAADDIIYVSANGACIVYKGKVLHLETIPKEHVKGIIKDCRNFKAEISRFHESGESRMEDILPKLKNCELSASTSEVNYLESRNQEYIDLINYGYRNRFETVDDLLLEERPVIKISLYRKEGILPVFDRLFPKWDPYVKCTTAGKEWIDFMDRSVDKGNAIRFLQDYLKISKEETVAFGDNGNDVGMMKAAGRSFAVENAVAEVKKASTDCCPGYEKKGVYHKLCELFPER